MTIPIPTGMIFGRPAVWTGLKIARILLKSKYSGVPADAKEKIASFFEDLPEESVYLLCAEFMKIKRKYGTWTLLEVEAKDGDSVQITL